MKDLIIAGVEVIRDEAGRYNLNALHRASGGNPIHAPSQWLRLKSTKELIDEVDMQISTSGLLPVETIKGGVGVQGTFAHELLVVSYAGWISPAFQLKVNQAFLDMNKKDQDLALPANYIEALEALIESEKEKIKIGKELEEAKPKIDYFNKVSRNESNMNATQVAKKFGMSAVALNRILMEFGVYNKLIKRGKTFNQGFIDKGYGRMIMTEAGYSQAVFTPKGEQYIAELLIGEGII